MLFCWPVLLYPSPLMSSQIKVSSKTLLKIETTYLYCREILVNKFCVLSRNKQKLAIKMYKHQEFESWQKRPHIEWRRQVARVRFVGRNRKDPRPLLQKESERYDSNKVELSSVAMEPGFVSTSRRAEAMNIDTGSQYYPQVFFSANRLKRCAF